MSLLSELGECCIEVRLVCSQCTKMHMHSLHNVIWQKYIYKQGILVVKNSHLMDRMTMAEYSLIPNDRPVVFHFTLICHIRNR